jgi:hypothetical protein
MTEDELKQLVACAQAKYMAMTPQEKADHDHEQRRSFVRGMCPDDQDYVEWCNLVDRMIPPLSQSMDAEKKKRLASKVAERRAASFAKLRKSSHFKAFEC